MPQILSSSEFLAAPGPILDVRSPSEYVQGHLPGALNLPLFSDAERAKVGICYKQQGQEQALELGLSLFLARRSPTGKSKAALLVATAKALAPNQQVRLHCWRGGMRSGSVAWLLEMAGFQVTLLDAGYKAFRHWVRATLSEPKPLLVLGGSTGTGKTALLAALAQRGEQVLNLEGLANHRGSSYGALGLPPQPTTEQFENDIAWQWCQFNPHSPIWVEAESRQIGSCRIPSELFSQMAIAPAIQVTRPRSERIAILLESYGQADPAELVAATERLRKRLGGLRTQTAIELIQQGQVAAAMEIVLDYYDKAYHYDLQQRTAPIHSLELVGLSPEASAQALITQSRQVLPNRALSSIL